MLPVKAGSLLPLGDNVPVSLVSDKFSLKQWKFPGGEVGVKLEGSKGNTQSDFLGAWHRIDVTGIVTSDDFFTLINVVSALHHAGVVPDDIIVYMPYLPYARQDRVCHEGESHALATYALVLSTLAPSIGSFVVTDLHSDVSKDFLERIFGDKLMIEVQSSLVYLSQYLENTLPVFDAVVAPDAGAAPKAALIQPESLHVQLTKTRAGGKVSTSISDDQYDKIVGSACIFDDICDGGATFIVAASVLRQTQPRMTSLSLYITHGIFSQGVDRLLEIFDNIYVYNLMIADPSVAQKVKVIQ